MDTAGGLADILAQFESLWLGREVEGEQYCRRKPPSSTTSWPAWSKRSATSIRRSTPLLPRLPFGRERVPQRDVFLVRDRARPDGLVDIEHRTRVRIEHRPLW